MATTRNGATARDAATILRRKALRFDYDLDFANLDVRAHPELYRIGKGEQGVLLVEPYKSELLPHWRFKTPDIARASAEKLSAMFAAYGEQGDFVGMDMARKFLQMGWTRARRYANHPGGRKWSPDHATLLPYRTDPIKAESAAIFYAAYHRAKSDPTYLRLRDQHIALVEADLRRLVDSPPNEADPS